MKRINLEQSLYLKGMPYGYPGSGKTWFCGTFANDERTAPVLHIDCAGNPETLTQLPKMGDVLRIEKIADLNAIYDWFVRGQPNEHVMVKEFGLTSGYKTLVFDGISDLQRYSFEAVMNDTGIAIANIPKTAEWSDYRGVLAMMSKISKRFFQLDMHVIITAWEKTEVDNDTGAQRFRPFLQGQSIDTVPGYALFVGRMIHPSRLDGQLAKFVKDHSEVAKSVMVLVPGKSYDAKDQNGIGQSLIINPTATKLLNAIEAKKVN